MLLEQNFYRVPRTYCELLHYCLQSVSADEILEMKASTVRCYTFTSEFVAVLQNMAKLNGKSFVSTAVFVRDCAVRVVF